MDEHCQVALGECRLLAGDCIQRDIGVGDDPLAVALRYGAVFFDPFGFKAANADA